MTHQDDYTVINDLAEKGLEAVTELMRILINNVMRELHALGWSQPYLWRSARSGRSENIIALASH